MPSTIEIAEHAAASLRARAGGYVVDMVIFTAISLIMIVIAGFVLLLSTDFAKQDASDPDFYAFLATIGLGIPVVWTGLNVLLLALRSQTGGQYVAGVRTLLEDDGRLNVRDAIAWWFCFNPLLFSWPMAVVAGLPLAAVIALALSRGTIVVFGVVETVCLVAPVIAVVSAALDSDHRALHDRVIGTRVVPAE